MEVRMAVLVGLALLATRTQSSLDVGDASAPRRTSRDGWKRRALDAVEAAVLGRDANCSGGPLALAEPADRHFRKPFASQTQTLSIFAILLRNLLDAEPDVDDADPLYASLARTVVQSDAAVYGCAVYVEREGEALSGSLVTYAYRNRTEVEVCPTRTQSTRTTANSSQGDGGGPSCAVADELGAGRDADDELLLVQIVNHYKKELGNGTQWWTAGHWSAPWYSCGHGAWIAAYSLPVVSGQRWRGVVVVNVNLSVIDVNQCAQNDGLFSDTHLCHRETMQCIPRAGRGFRRGAYSCACQPGHFFPNSSSGVFLDGDVLEATFGASPAENLENLYQDFRCLPCRSGCYDCTDPSPCFVDYDILWRSAPLGLQSFCMTITVVLGICVFRLRKCKVIATGMWTVLEMILVGALLLYSTVVIRYFEPLTLGCLLEPWFREMGFAICYGTIILKLYRILVEFRTRKAHRWVIRDKDLLKYLAGIVLVVMGYMSAWTAVSVDHIREGDSIVDLGKTEDGLRFYICKSRWWDYVTEVGETSFLLFGIYISYHVRNATSPYKEKRYLCLAIYIEALVSLLLYVFRHHVWLTLHPDYIFLMYFARCQLTVTITLILIFGPKLWYHYKPPREGEGDHSRTTADGQDHVAPEVLKLQDGITSNGEVDIGEINLADMDPEDIRSELRRVYTQLQILRNKTMRKDNPHISKRRGGRKATHRRFSLQAFHRHRHHHEPDHETDVSKTPEESTGSADAGAQASDSNEATGGLNVAGAKKATPAQ